MECNPLLPGLQYNLDRFTWLQFKPNRARAAGKRIGVGSAGAQLLLAGFSEQRCLQAGGVMQNNDRMCMFSEEADL